VADTATTLQGSPVSISVLNNDSDSDGTLVLGSVVVTSPPSRGSTAVDPQTGRVTYSPGSGFNGTDSFRYTVRDNNSATSNEATVTVTVSPIRFWQNGSNALDVNADGKISPIDALQVVNKLNEDGAGPLPDPTPGNQPPPFYDVNGDGFVTPADALAIVNVLNAMEGEQGEFGEGEAAAGTLSLAFSPGFSEFVLPASPAEAAEQGLRSVQQLAASAAGVTPAPGAAALEPALAAAASPREDAWEESLDALLAADQGQAGAEAADLLFAELFQ
jgi:hypothetical protein